jgi:hypothetical protein
MGALSPQIKEENKMTGREFLEWASFEGNVEDVYIFSESMWGKEISISNSQMRKSPQKMVSR